MTLAHRQSIRAGQRCRAARFLVQAEKAWEFDRIDGVFQDFSGLFGAGRALERGAQGSPSGRRCLIGPDIKTWMVYWVLG